ncbi:MAG: hypothetical protein NZ555_02415 [Geminicoccaceae bacterium]|nr:hypothetical protein [Geminicoccaceae bacterium]MCX8099973.1 hypothetical protein [Geminicoccaceae bacterium]MDW8369605.1 hypothetical protein [Geminicoccaceae bacterium]
MSGLERVVVLLALIEKLCEVMARENDCVRRFALDPLSELQAEKRTLAQAYEKELDRLRREPELLGALPLEPRRQLEEAMRRMRAAARRNAEVLSAAKTVSERLLRRLSEALAEEPRHGALASGAAPRGRVIAMSVDRQV